MPPSSPPSGWAADLMAATVDLGLDGMGADCRDRPNSAFDLRKGVVRQWVSGGSKIGMVGKGFERATQCAVCKAKPPTDRRYWAAVPAVAGARR